MPLYAVGRAAKLAQVPANTASRWHKAYRNGNSPLGQRERGQALSYFQLIELRVVRALRESHKIKLYKIAEARDFLAKQLKTQFPFASTRLKTDGANILADLPETKNLVNANAGGQIELDGIIQASLSEFIYDDELVTSWELVRGASPIIIDPKLNLGRSSIQGITTESIHDLLLAGEKARDVAENFGLSLSEIDLAFKFESEENTIH